MKNTLLFVKNNREQKGKSAERRSFLCHNDLCSNQRGNVLFYILIAIALLGMLTFAFVGDNGENISKQNSYKMSEELYGQFNLINTAVMSCIIEHPKGGGDLDVNGKIEVADNDNRPYPLSPSDPNNSTIGGAETDNQARKMKCPGSGVGIFQGVGSVGNYLPSPPSEFAEWELLNDANGVRLQIIGSNAGLQAITTLQKKFDGCRTDVNYGGCGAACLSIWIKKNAGCP